MKSKFQFVTLAIILWSSMTSCVEDLDFSQFGDLQATPRYEASILYLEAPENVINLVSGSSVFSQNFNFEAFSSDIFADRVLDGVITFIVENTTSKELQITIEFLDEADVVTDTEFFTIEAAPTAILQREITYGNAGKSIDIIKSLTTIRVSAVNLGDNSSTSNLPDPMITLKSSGQFTLRVK